MHNVLQQSYTHILTRTYEMVDTLLQSLEEDWEECKDSQPYAVKDKRREKIISALVKLSQLQIRLMPWQAQAAKEDVSTELTDQKRAEYFEMLERFFEKRHPSASE